MPSALKVPDVCDVSDYPKGVLYFCGEIGPQAFETGLLVFDSLRAFGLLIHKLQDKSRSCTIAKPVDEVGDNDDRAPRRLKRGE